MKVFISGSEKFDNIDEVEFWLTTNFSIPTDTLLISGNTNVDALLEKWAIENDADYEIMLEDYDQAITAANRVVCFYDGRDVSTVYIIGQVLKARKNLEVLF